MAGDKKCSRIHPRNAFDGLSVGVLSYPGFLRESYQGSLVDVPIIRQAFFVIFEFLRYLA